MTDAQPLAPVPAVPVEPTEVPSQSRFNRKNIITIAAAALTLAGTVAVFIAAFKSDDDETSTDSVETEKTVKKSDAKS